MQSAIPDDSKYIPLTQQKWHCVPTCIQIIMLKHNLPIFPAELMGRYFEILVPKEDVKLFYNPKTGPRPKLGYGTQISEEVGANKMFKELKIPLKMKFHLIDKFKDLKEFKKYLQNIADKEVDIVACFENSALFGKKAKGGHACVLDKVYSEKGKVRLIDPSRHAPKWREVSISKLYQAMKVHGKEQAGGFWELHRT